MGGRRLLDVPGVIAIEGDESGTALRIDASGNGNGHLQLSVPLSPAEVRELAANLARWADTVEPPRTAGRAS